MTSYFDDIYRESAAPILMEYHGDEDTVTYRLGSTTVTGIVAMIGHAEVIESEGPDGTIRKVWRMPLHFLREEASKWLGIDDPQFKGVFTIKGLTWRIEPRDALSIEGSSETFVSVNVVRKMAVHKGQPNLREFS